MKQIYFILITFIIPATMYGCPTCVARVTKDSPTFFAQEFYQTLRQAQDEKRNYESKRTQDQHKKESSCQKKKT